LDSQGFPHLSYTSFIDDSSCDLKYAYQDSSGWHIETIDTGGDVGRHNSLALDTNGFPHISYADLSNELVKYAFKDGSGWHIESVDSGVYYSNDDVGLTAIGLDVTGRPHIIYRNDSRDLTYAYKNANGWNIEFVDGVSGDKLSMALDNNGYPHITYLKFPESKYAYRDSTGWHMRVLEIEDYYDNNGPPSLALNENDYPHMCYPMLDYENNIILLKYVYKDLTGWHDEIVESSSLWYCSIALDNDGNPHISYQESDRWLMYTRLIEFSEFSYFPIAISE
jgi:hypothetical protein